MKKSKTNDLKLLEFIKNWNSKEWIKLNKLGNSGYLLSLRTKTKEYLNVLVKQHSKFKRSQKFSKVIFESIANIKIETKDWSQFTYEVLLLCNHHLKSCLLDENSRIFIDLGKQYYFLDHSMSENLDQQKKKNRTTIFEEYIIDKSFQGCLISYFEELEQYDLKNKEKRQNLIDFKQWSEGNELYYHENKLRILCSKAQRSSFNKMVENNEVDLNYLDQIPSTIQKYPQIQLYSLALRLHIEKSEAIFYELKSSLDEILDSLGFISNKYIEPLFIQILNFCVERVLTGDDSFRQIYIDICLKLLNKNLLLEQGKLHGGHYKNIVTSYAKMDRIKEAQLFIYDFKQKLHLKEKSPFAIYSQAFVYYYKNQYSEAWQLLYDERKITNEMDDFVKVDTKILYSLSCLILKKLDKFEKEMRNLPLMLQRRDNISEKYLRIWGTTASILKRINDTPYYQIIDTFPKFITEIKNNKRIRHRSLIIDYLNKKIDEQL